MAGAFLAGAAFVAAGFFAGAALVAGAFFAGAALPAGAAFVAGAALVTFVVEPSGVAALAADPREPTALRAVAAACLATDNARLATM